MAFGTDGYIGISKQESYSVATSAYHWMPFVSEGITDAIEVLMEETIRDRYDEPPTIEGLTTVEGDIAFELNPIDSGLLWYAACGQASSTALQSGYVFQHEFLPIQTRFDSNLALQPVCMHIYRGVDEAFEYMDGQLSSIEFNLAAGALAKLSTTWICRTSSLRTALTASYHTDTQAFAWHAASISMAGTGITDYEEINVSINNALEGVSLIDGTKVYSRIHRNGFREVRVSGTIDLPDLNEYDQFRSQSERQLILTLTGDEVRSGYNESFVINIPKFRYETFPVNIGGPGRITVGFAGRAIYHTGSGCSIKMTMVNTLASY